MQRSLIILYQIIQINSQQNQQTRSISPHQSFNQSSIISSGSCVLVTQRSKSLSDILPARPALISAASDKQQQHTKRGAAAAASLSEHFPDLLCPPRKKPIIKSLKHNELPFAFALLPRARWSVSYAHPFNLFTFFPFLPNHIPGAQPLKELRNSRSRPA